MPDSKDTGHRPDARRIPEAWLGADLWHVGRYELVDGLVRGMDLPGVMGGWQTPRPSRQLVEAIAGLRQAADVEILDWVRSHGFLGTGGEATNQEAIEDIRFASSQLAVAAELLEALVDGRPKAELHELAKRGRGGRDWLTGDGLRADAWMARAERVGMTDGPSGGVRKEDLDALDALGELLAYWLAITTRPSVRAWSTRRVLHLEPNLVAKTPLGAAFLDLFERATKIAFSRAPGRRLLAGELRRCEACGNTFHPQRDDQRFCSTRCQWRQNKAEARARAKETRR